MSDRVPDCTVFLDGSAVRAVAGEPVAVGLWAAGVRVLSRSVKYHRPRAAFCLAGHCGACLMRIDGQPNVKACQTALREGQRIEHQNSWPAGEHDLLSAADAVFPRGMDHHTMFTSPRAANALLRKMVHRLGGLGRLPERGGELAALPSGRRRKVDVAVIGAGPAGLAAALTCAQDGKRSVVVYDEQDRPGGSLLSHPRFGIAAADALAAEARAVGVELRCHAAAIAWYPEDDGGLLAIDDGGVLTKLTARRYIYATGSYDVNALFENNDRPGIWAARAVGLLATRYRVKLAGRTAILGDGAYAHALAEALASAGSNVEHLASERVLRARGRLWVSGLDLEGGRRVRCDRVAVAAVPAPASELARQHGAAVELRAKGGGFACLVDGRGATRVDQVYACGDVCSFVGVEAARAHGHSVGRAVAESLA